MAEALRGLDAQEAAARLKRDGFNELEAPVRRTIWRIVWEVLREPMLQLLIAAGVVYVVLGDRTEALMLLSFVAITASITVLQERRAERVLESLRDLSSPRALVIRDGERQRIAGREVVIGDLLVLIEGDRVPADGMLITATDCRIDESLLTGESVPVTKLAPDTATLSTPHSDGSGLADPAQSTAMRPGGDGLPSVYGGTLVRKPASIRMATWSRVKTSGRWTMWRCRPESPMPVSLPG
jgi:Ca2+-transporting ATPase